MSQFKNINNHKNKCCTVKSTAENWDFNFVSINIIIQDCSTCGCSALKHNFEILKSKNTDILFASFCFLRAPIKKSLLKIIWIEYKTYQHSFVLNWHHTFAIRLPIIVISWYNCWIPKVILNTIFWNFNTAVIKLGW